MLFALTLLCSPLLLQGEPVNPLYPDPKLSPDFSTFYDDLADACLKGARGSLCSPLEQLSSRLETALEALEALRQPPPQCPAGWSRHGSSCYLIPPQTATWLQAHHSCALLDRRARLGSVHPASAQLVKTLVAASSSDRVWIGLTQLPGRRWGWTDGSPLDYTDWRRGEPSYNGELCAHIYGPRNSLEGWNDTECDRDRHFLCEIQLDQQ